jgi:hypothetical protein
MLLSATSEALARLRVSDLTAAAPCGPSLFEAHGILQAGRSRPRYELGATGIGKLENGSRPEAINEIARLRRFLPEPDPENRAAITAFCIDGSFSNLAPYTVESYGVRLGARSSGLGQTANGVGKILGPLSIAVIAGTSNIISPQATEGALTGGFLFLAAGMALVGMSFLFLGVETHGRAMTVAAEPEAIAPAAATPR